MTLAIIQIARVGEASGFAGMTRPSRISELEPVPLLNFLSISGRPGARQLWRHSASPATLPTLAEVAARQRLPRGAFACFCPRGGFPRAARGVRQPAGIGTAQHGRHAARRRRMWCPPGTPPFGPGVVRADSADQTSGSDWDIQCYLGLFPARRAAGQASGQVPGLRPSPIRDGPALPASAASRS